MPYRRDLSHISSDFRSIQGRLCPDETNHEDEFAVLDALEPRLQSLEQERGVHLAPSSPKAAFFYRRVLDVAEHFASSGGNFERVMGSYLAALIHERAGAALNLHPSARFGQLASESYSVYLDARKRIARDVPPLDMGYLLSCSSFLSARALHAAAYSGPRMLADFERDCIELAAQDLNAFNEIFRRCAARTDRRSSMVPLMSNILQSVTFDTDADTSEALKINAGLARTLQGGHPLAEAALNNFAYLFDVLACGYHADQKKKEVVDLVIGAVRTFEDGAGVRAAADRIFRDRVVGAQRTPLPMPPLAPRAAYQATGEVPVLN